MKRSLLCGFALLLSSPTILAGVITEPTDFETPTIFSFDDAMQPLLRGASSPAAQFANLSDDEKYALMLTSTQNGQIESAIAIAEALNARAADVQVRALRAGRLVQRYELPAAEAQLNTLKPGDKFEIATVELMRALLEMSRNSDGKALQHIDKVLAQLPDHPYAHNVKGVLLVGNKRYADAKQAFGRALSKIPQMEAAEVNWGFAELYDNRAAEALQHFERAIKINSGNCSARLGKATVVRAQGNPSLALETLGTCSTNRQDLDVRMLVAESMMDLGKPADAATYLRQSDGLEKNPRAQLLMAKVSLRNGDADTAIRYANGNDHQAAYYKSVAYLAKGDAPSAQRALDPLLKTSPVAVNARVLSSIAKLQLKQPLAASDIQTIGQNKTLAPFAALLNAMTTSEQTAAVSQFKSSAGLLRGVDYSGVGEDSIMRQLKSAQMPDVAAALFFDLMGMQPSVDRYLTKNASVTDGFLAQYLLGMTTLQASKVDTAVKYLRESLRLAPQFFSAQYLLADAYMRKNQLDVALVEYEKALALKAEAGVFLRAGVVAEQLGKLDVAEKHLRAVVQKAPNNFIGYNQLAWFLASNNRKLDEALAFSNKATQLAPNDPNVLDTQGWVHYTKGDYPAAVTTLSRANELSGRKNAGILFHLAMAQHKQGNKQAALDSAQRAKAIGVQPAYASQLDRLLAELQRAK